MNLHIRLYINFWSHRKTAKLRALLGNDALWIMPRLWSYAAENQPDGNFGTYSPEEIALLIGYQGDAQAMLKAMLQASFMDEGMKLHGWEEHNGYHHAYSERAKHAARIRWEKVREAEENNSSPTPPPKGKDRRGEETSIAPSIAKASKKALTNEEFIEALKKNSAYSHIQIDRELCKMDAWLLKHPNRQKNSKFILNWLNKIEVPMEISKYSNPITKATGAFAD